MPCCVMLCYEECPATDVHSVLRYVAKHRMHIHFPDDGLRTETWRRSFSVLKCKFYISALVGIIIE